MSVLFDSSSTKVVTGITGGSGSASSSHIVNTLATGLVAVVGALWAGPNDSSSGTLSATFGGTAMTGSTTQLWQSNGYAFRVFTLANPGTGPQTVTVTASGMGTVSSTLTVVAATYSGVDQIGSVVSSSPSTTTSNSIAVTSGTPAYRVVTLHANGGGFGYSLTSYNLVQRALQVNQLWPFGVYGDVLLGDGVGAATVTGTATQNSTANWGAFGVSLSPALVQGNASLKISMSEVSSGHLYRAGIPSPLRTWVIES